MPSAELRARFAAAPVARLATVTAEGRPHVVPCCFALDGDTVYSAVDEKPKSTRALRRLDNVRASGRASLLVDHYEDDWSRLWWIRLDGTARVLESGTEFGRAMRLLAAKYEQYARTPPRGPVLALDLARWTSWSADGLA